MDPRRAVGAQAERRAARALEAAGLRVIERNLRLPGGELDLICRDGDAWVFVEVKARRAGWDDSPAAAVSWAKQRRLVRLAQHYLKWRGLRDARCRFDVVEVVAAAAGEVRIRHLRSAFDAPPG
jgi:putative endonuclease